MDKPATLDRILLLRKNNPANQFFMAAVDTSYLNQINAYTKRLTRMAICDQNIGISKAISHIEVTGLSE